MGLAHRGDAKLKRLLIIMATLVLVISIHAPAFAKTHETEPVARFESGFQMEGRMGHLEYDDDGQTAGYSFGALGGSIIGNYIESTLIGDVGITGSLGMAVAGRSTLNGSSFVSTGWLQKARCYDYCARAGLRYGFTVEEISLYAETHVSWDSVVFQEGYTQTWERLSFHTFGVGAGAGISRFFEYGPAAGLNMTLSFSYDIGLKSFTASRSRANWETSAATTKDIKAQSGIMKVSLGITADL